MFRAKSGCHAISHCAPKFSPLLLALKNDIPGPRSARKTPSRTICHLSLLLLHFAFSALPPLSPPKRQYNNNLFFPFPFPLSLLWDSPFFLSEVLAFGPLDFFSKLYPADRGGLTLDSLPILSDIGGHCSTIEEQKWTEICPKARTIMLS